MNALGWLVLGLLLGWAIEFAIDYLYWRRKAQAEAEALAQQEAALNAQQTEMGHRQSTLRLREKEMSDLQASLASRDAELLQQARRVEERSDDLSRVEQAIEKRRADLDRMGLTLNEREKEIATRGDQLRTKEVNYNRRLDTLENTEAELARRVAVVTNREEAMQSWEGRILSREHDVADREASVNYHANRIARDAGSFEAVKHLLRQHYRTDEGRDRLQALVGIDYAFHDAILGTTGNQFVSSAVHPYRDACSGRGSGATESGEVRSRVDSQPQGDPGGGGETGRGPGGLPDAGAHDADARGHSRRTRAPRRRGLGEPVGPERRWDNLIS